MMFALLLAITSLMLTKRYQGYPLLFIPLYYLLIDYANYSLGLSDDLLGLVAKSLNELILVGAAFLVLNRIAIRRTAPKGATIFIVVSIAFLILGAIKNGVTIAILDWRTSIAPIVIAWLAAEAGILNLSTLNKIYKFTSILITINSIYAIQQYITFDGNIESHWRYAFLLDEKLKANSDYETRFIYYQLLRDNELRSSGMFVSALQYSYAAAFASFYFLVNLVSSLRKKDILTAFVHFIFASCCIGGVLVSQVRASLIILAISLIIFFACYSYSTRNSFNYRRSILILTGSILSYALVLFMFGSKFDSSVQGRVVQYFFGLDNFTPLGYWPGSFRGQFDSYYIYGLLTFGLAMPIWIACIIKLYASGFKKANSLDLVGSDRTCLTIAFCVIPSILLLACFQHVAGSLFYQLAWFSLFVQAKTSAKKAGQNHLRTQRIYTP